MCSFYKFQCIQYAIWFAPYGSEIAGVSRTWSKLTLFSFRLSQFHPNLFPQFYELKAEFTKATMHLYLGA